MGVFGGPASCPRGILGQQGTGTHYPHSCTCSVTPLFSGADILSNFFRICRNSIPPPRHPATHPPATRPPCPPRPLATLPTRSPRPLATCPPHPPATPHLAATLPTPRPPAAPPRPHVFFSGLAPCAEVERQRRKKRFFKLALVRSCLVL